MRFQTLQQLIAICEKEKQSIAEVMLADQQKESGESREIIFQRMHEYYQVMKEAVERGLTEDTKSRSGLTGGDAKRVSLFAKDFPAALGGEAVQAMANALAVSEVNASMGRIIATPTAGSCGIIPGVFVSVQQRFDWSDEHMTNGLFAAGAIGYVIANQSFVSGAEGGCQAEVGSAIAMAAGALTELRGGNVTQSIHAVGLALKNSLGLVCDPVGGLVEVPCIVRNGFGAVTALAASDMAMAGVRSVIPSDEVIGAMKEIGQAMSSNYRETARGGLARTPTGKQIMKELKKSSRRG